jgi:methionyl-tRNA formyltransferase
MFRALLDSQHTVTLLVTKPQPAEHGRGGPPPNPMRQEAERQGLPVFDPASINTPEARARLAQDQPDLLVVADYGQILAPETLAVARLGGINLHGSILPKYRGAAPINWALYNGDAETGVTVIHMTPRVDAGPIVAVARTPIDPDEDAVALERRLSELGAPLVVDVVDRLAAGPLEALTQDPALASPARRLRKSDATIDWTRTAEQIRNQVRAFEPWPRSVTFWQRPGAEPVRLILGKVHVEPAEAPTAPGSVVAAHGDQLAIACGTDLLRIESLQPAGKRMMNAGEFLRGHPVRPGDMFGAGN